MKPLVVILVVVLLSFIDTASAARSPSKGRKLTDLNVIPTRVLQRSVSPKFYKSLLISPVEGWIVVRGQLSGTRISGARVIQSELKGLYDPLALQLAKEAQIAGNFTLERPNVKSSVLLHLLVYQIADATMVLSFAHFDEAGGDQMQYYGCSRLLILKDEKWSEIQGPESLAGKGWAVRQGLRNSVETVTKLETFSKGAESTNMAGH
ncbi:MAG TPA: hypothetical protein VEX43_15280 [Chthoniobacterales bacterium]|nr:hypothetical protein [Chthoniobacterales bacterium]